MPDEVQRKQLGNARTLALLTLLTAASITHAKPELDLKKALGFEDSTIWGGEGLGADAADAREGSNCLVWKDSKTNGRVRLKNANLDLSKARMMTFWLHSDVAHGKKIAVVLNSNTDATPEDDYYVATVPVVWSGWRKVEIPFEDFVTKRSPAGWDKITGIIFAGNGYGTGEGVDNTDYKLDGIEFPGAGLFGAEAPAPVIIEGFERAFGFENARDWPGLVNDSEEPRDGEYSGKWQDANSGDTVRAALFPSDLSDFGTMELSIFAPVAGDNRLTFFVEADNPATPEVDGYRTAAIVKWQGWRDISVPFAKMKPTGTPAGWDHITGFSMKQEGKILPPIKFDRMGFAQTTTTSEEARK